MQPEPSLGEPRGTDLLAASSDAVSGRRVAGGREASRNGPKEIRAATQRRLLGAFRFSWRSRVRVRDRHSRRWVPVHVVPRQYRAPGGRPAGGSTRPSAVRSRAEHVARDPRRPRFGQDPVLTRRIAWRSHECVIDPPHVLALTFTRNAAGELTQAPRPARRRPCGHRRHPPPVALAQLRRRAEDETARCPGCSSARSGCSCGSSTPRWRAGHAPPTSPPRSSGRRRGWSAPTCTRRRWRSRGAPPSPGRRRRRRLPRVRAPQAAPGPRRLRRPPQGVRGRARARRGFRRAQRFRFRHLFVDEFQDASPRSSACCVLARRRLRPHGRRRPRPGDLRVRRRRPTFLVGSRAFPAQRFPDVCVVRLEHNYRSTPQVVSAAGAVLADSRRRTEPRAARAPAPQRSSPPTTPTMRKRAA